jgi:hypothetical protein
LQQEQPNRAGNEKAHEFVLAQNQPITFVKHEEACDVLHSFAALLGVAVAALVISHQAGSFSDLALFAATE